MSRVLIVTILIALAPVGLQSQRPAPTTGAEEQVRRVERQYLDARLANDTATLRQVLADEFTSIGSSGGVADRADALRLPTNRTPGGDEIKSMDLDSLRVRVYGSTAVVTGLRRMRGPTGPLGAGLRFTHVFVKRNGRWQLVASQVTSVQDPSSAR